MNLAKDGRGVIYSIEPHDASRRTAHFLALSVIIKRVSPRPVDLKRAQRPWAMSNGARRGKRNLRTFIDPQTAITP